MLKQFKLLGMVALLAAAMLMVSCSKEDKIVGKWKITHASGDFSDDKGSTWNFKDNGKCSIVVGNSDFDGEWSLSNDCLTIDIEYSTSSSEGKVIGEFDIDELSSSEMSLSGQWNDSWSYNGSRQTRKYKVSYDFEKK